MGAETTKKRPKISKKMIGIGLAVLIIGMSGYALTSKDAGASTDTSGMYVKTAVVEERDIESKVFTSGTVIAKDVRNITPDISGKIDTLFIAEGDVVKKGDVLAKLNSEDLEFQLADARVQYKIETINLNNLNQSSSSEVTYKNAKLRYDDAKKAYEDKTTLYESGAVSKADLNAAKTALDLAKNDYDLAKASYDQNVDVAIQQLRVETAENSVKKLEKALADTEIKAPIDGTVTVINGKELDIVSQTSPLFVVESTGDLAVETYIGEYDVNLLAVGQNVVIKGEGLTGKTYDGEVSFISSTAVTRNVGQSKDTAVRVEIDILDKETDYRPNFSANVEIETGLSEQAIGIPYESIFREPDGTLVVYTVVDGNAVRNEIQMGVQGDIYIEVLSDNIASGNVVILDPSSEIEDGATVRYDEVM